MFKISMTRISQIGVGTPGADFNVGYGVEAQGRSLTEKIRD